MGKAKERSFMCVCRATDALSSRHLGRSVHCIVGPPSPAPLSSQPARYKMGPRPTTSARRDKARIATMLPRAGGQIKELQHTFQKKEMNEWLDNNMSLLPTLLFVCKSGMLRDVEADLRKEHWLPPSNTYFHNVARAFFGLAVSKLCKDATVELLQELTTGDSDSVWKLLFMATLTNRNTRVPTTHKHSFLELLEKRHNELGKPLAKLNWKDIKKSKTINWTSVGLFKTEKDTTGDIIALIYNNTQEKYTFGRPISGRMELSNNWCLAEARLEDPEDEEDPVRIARRFKSLNKEWGFTPEEIQAAETANNADAVRIKSDDAADSDEDATAMDSGPKDEEDVSGSAADEPAKPARKKAKTTQGSPNSKKNVPQPPTVTPIKATRRPKGVVKGTT